MGVFPIKLLHFLLLNYSLCKCYISILVLYYTSVVPFGATVKALAYHSRVYFDFFTLCWQWPDSNLWTWDHHSTVLPLRCCRCLFTVVTMFTLQATDVTNKFCNVNHITKFACNICGLYYKHCYKRNWWLQGS